MSTDENKAVARRLIEEAWNQGNIATVDELMEMDTLHQMRQLGVMP